MDRDDVRRSDFIKAAFVFWDQMGHGQMLALVENDQGHNQTERTFPQQLVYCTDTVSPQQTQALCLRTRTTYANNTNYNNNTHKPTNQ
jgi:hypothetical protein